MANFGLDDLRLVNPRAGWPRVGEYRDVAYAAAAGAAPLLDGARVFDSVAAAVGDLNFLYAATARERGQMKCVITPARAMSEAAVAAEKRGVLFGPERTGLDNDEVGLADAIITFPANPACSSLNLAQAVLLVGYEWFKAAHGDAPPPPTVPRALSPPAPREMILAFFDFLEGRLDDAGFFRPATKRPGMRRNLRNMFHRMAMTEQDVRTFWGAVVRLVEGPRSRSRRASAIGRRSRGPESASGRCGSPCRAVARRAASA